MAQAILFASRIAAWRSSSTPEFLLTGRVLRHEVFIDSDPCQLNVYVVSPKSNRLSIIFP